MNIGVFLVSVIFILATLSAHRKREKERPSETLTNIVMLLSAIVGLVVLNVLFLLATTKSSLNMYILLFLSAFFIWIAIVLFSVMAIRLKKKKKEVYNEEISAIGQISESNRLKKASDDRLKE